MSAAMVFAVILGGAMLAAMVVALIADELKWRKL